MVKEAANDPASVLQGSIERLTSDGFVLLPGLCSAALVELILKVARRRARKVRDALGAREIGIGSAAGYVEIVQRSPGRWDVPIKPEDFGVDDRQMPWWRLVAAALGEDAEHSFSGVVFSEPDSPAQFWHTDSPHTSPEQRPPHAINVLVALHGIPMAMGPTECASGSHVLTNHLANPSLVLDQLIYQHADTSPEMLARGTEHDVPEGCVEPLTTGSCLVFDDRILHRGLANRSDATRHVAYFSYRSKGYDENTHFESQRSVYDTAV